MTTRSLRRAFRTHLVDGVRWTRERTPSKTRVYSFLVTGTRETFIAATVGTYSNPYVVWSPSGRTRRFATLDAVARAIARETAVRAHLPAAHRFPGYTPYRPFIH